MKRLGFDKDSRRYRSNSCSGGQIMPPVMGAVAFWCQMQHLFLMEQSACSIVSGRSLLPGPISAGIILSANRKRIPVDRKKARRSYCRPILKRLVLLLPDHCNWLRWWLRVLSTARAAFYTTSFCVLWSAWSPTISSFTLKNTVSPCRCRKPDERIHCLYGSRYRSRCHQHYRFRDLEWFLPIITMLASGSSWSEDSLTAVVCNYLGNRALYSCPASISSLSAFSSSGYGWPVFLFSIRSSVCGSVLGCKLQRSHLQ